MSYDAAFFKVLAANDTGQRRGHQGGLVIPKELVQYFPNLPEAGGPTSDRGLTLILMDGDRFVGRVHSRYQFQTWGGKRQPEYRLTKNLNMLLDSARANDILMLERHEGSTDRFKATLVRAGTEKHTAILKGAANPRWGPVSQQPPATQTDLEAARASVLDDADREFSLTEPAQLGALTIVQRRLRPPAFRGILRNAYGLRCALCGEGMVTPMGEPEVAGAHIYPLAGNGSNDPRNGLALCASHHWGFDRFLWTIDQGRSVYVPQRVRNEARNRSLLQFVGHSLRLPADPRHQPALVALAWHEQRAKKLWT